VLSSERLAHHHPATHFTRVTFGGKTGILGPQIVRDNGSPSFVASASLGQARGNLLPG